jgi:hypothetical protein
MKKTMRFASIAIAAALLAAPCFPQTPENKPDEQTKYYRLDFTVKELEGGKVVNARNYSTSLSNQKADGSSIRTGDKIPLQSDKGSWSYVDIGVNIDCNSLKLIDNQLAVHVSADITSVGTDASAGTANPLIRQNRWSSTVLVPLKKPVTIFSSDGASTKRQMQLELTATPLL